MKPCYCQSSASGGIESCKYQQNHKRNRRQRRCSGMPWNRASWVWCSPVASSACRSSTRRFQWTSCWHASLRRMSVSGELHQRRFPGSGRQRCPPCSSRLRNRFRIRGRGPGFFSTRCPRDCRAARRHHRRPGLPKFHPRRLRSRLHLILVLRSLPMLPGPSRHSLHRKQRPRRQPAPRTRHRQASAKRPCLRSRLRQCLPKRSQALPVVPRRTQRNWCRHATVSPLLPSRPDPMISPRSLLWHRRRWRSLPWRCRRSRNPLHRRRRLQRHYRPLSRTSLLPRALSISPLSSSRRVWPGRRLPPQ